MATNKNTQYATSLIDFIKDTKPFRCKLTEIIEEYHFFDEVNVRIRDSMFTKIKINAVWPYNFYSGGDLKNRGFNAQRVVSPAFSKFTTNSDDENRGAYKAFRDENGDLANTPSMIGVDGITSNQTIFAYSKESFDNVGINDAFVERKGDKSTAEPLLEGHDFFQSHGAFTIQIKQTTNANGEFVPLYATTFDDNVISQSTNHVQTLALDKENPRSAINKITAILTEIKNLVSNPEALAELNKLFSILEKQDLPRSYDAFFTLVKQKNILTQEKIDAYYLKISNASPSLFFNAFTDLGSRSDGRLFYDNVKNSALNILNIQIDPVNAVFEEWTLTCLAITDENKFYFSVIGSHSGRIGTVVGGEDFKHLKISFITKIVNTPYVGQKISIVPRNKLVINKDAPLETWNLIKVNPLTYTRPVFVSSRFGHLIDDNGNIGVITILDKTIKDVTYVLQAISNSKFLLTKEDDPEYSENLTVGVKFSDGQISFTIMVGTVQPFLVGDSFIISITNIPAYIEDLRLGYGYDLDAYDDQTLPYNENVSPKIPLGFFYDTRFPFYDAEKIGLKVEEHAVDGRKWRMVAIPGDQHIVNIDTFDYPPGPRPDALEIYYADGFKVQYSDDDFTKVIVDVTPLGGLKVDVPFISAEQGISFVIRDGDKPFIGAISDDPGFKKAIGGDVFSFTVRNPPPETDGGGLNSKNIPRLIMHGDGFHHTRESKWVVDILSNTAYTVNEINDASNKSISSIDKGMSFKDLDIQFTLVGGRFGLSAGEKFTFKTFNKKPSYLVHGSVSGWQKDAEVGKYYSNGKISFKIDVPTPVLYTLVGKPIVVPTHRPFQWAVNKKKILLSRLRFDTPSLSYLLERKQNGYMVTRSDVGVIGFAAFDNYFSDQYIRLKAADVEMERLLIDINGSQFPLWNGQDLLIIRPKAKIKYPTKDDFVLVEKTRNGSIDLAITATTANINNLYLHNINSDFIPVLNEELGISSPETLIRSGWIPTFTSKEDVVESIAQFSDITQQHIVRSAATNELLGVLKPLTKNLNEPVIFEWDTSFLENYLPPNASATIVTTGTGWSEKVFVNLTESIKFLVKISNLPENTMFYENIKVAINETDKDTVSFKILSKYFENISVNIDEEKKLQNTNSNEALTDTDFEEVTALLSRGTGIGYDAFEYDRGGYDEGPEEKITFITKKYLPIDLSKIDGLSYDEYSTDYYIFGLARIIEVIFMEPPITTPIFNLWLPGQETYEQVKTVDKQSPTTFVFYIANSSLGKLIIS